MHAVVFLNGSVPSWEFAGKFINGKTLIIAADGVANFFKKNEVKPYVILGDFDSIKKSVLKYFEKKKVTLLHIKDQETTDFEKSLIYCCRKKIKKVLVFGATGKRSDHTLNNFSVMLRYSRKLNIKMITEELEIFFTGKKTKFRYKANELISLLGFPVARNISTSGLRYKLTNEDLEIGVREGALNESVSDVVTISYKSGSLLLFKKHFLNK